jgi:hypothetical protein
MNVETPEAEPLTDEEIEYLEELASEDGNIGKIARAWLRVEGRR